jgi:endonuclease YncB( thermonuclease family)
MMNVLPVPGYGPYPARVVAIHDGDTITFDLDLGFGVRLPGQSWTGKTMLACRVYGINAPELGTPEGQAALAYARTLLAPGDLCQVTSRGWDKFGGRFDGTVTMPGGGDFAGAMLGAGHAVPYTGGPR